MGPSMLLLMIKVVAVALNTVARNIVVHCCVGYAAAAAAGRCALSPASWAPPGAGQEAAGARQPADGAYGLSCDNRPPGDLLCCCLPMLQMELAGFERCCSIAGIVAVSVSLLIVIADYCLQ